MKKPKKRDGGWCDAIVQMRIRKGDLALLDRAAGALGISRSALIRRAAELEARHVLARPRLVENPPQTPKG